MTGGSINGIAGQKPAKRSSPGIKRKSASPAKTYGTAVVRWRRINATLTRISTDTSGATAIGIAIIEIVTVGGNTIEDPAGGKFLTGPSETYAEECPELLAFG